jgi:hypothetical protein
MRVNGDVDFMVSIRERESLAWPVSCTGAYSDLNCFST